MLGVYIFLVGILKISPVVLIMPCGKENFSFRCLNFFGKHFVV